MSHENLTSSSDLMELDSTWKQGVGCLFHQQGSGSSHTSPYQFDLRKLHFEYGTGIDFQVRYSIIMLQLSSEFDMQEQVANFHDATEVLHKARESLSKPKHPANLAVTTDLLQNTLNDFKKSSNLRHRIQKVLHEFQIKPEWDLDNIILEKWYSEARTFLEDLEPLVDELDLQHDVDTTRDAIKSIYDEMILVVEQDNLIVTEPRFTPDDTPTPYRLHQLHMKLAMIQDVDSQSMTSAERIQNLIDIYDDLYQVFPELINQDQIQWPQVLDDAFVSIRAELLSLLSQPETTQSLEGQDPHTDLDLMLRGCCHALISRIKMPVEDYLSKYLQYLQKRASNTTSLELEHLFHELASRVDLFSMKTPPGLTETQWLKYAPRVFAYTRGQNFLNKLQYIHAAYQKKAYVNHEMSRLWLAIWQGLKTTYLIAHRSKLKLSKPEFPVEVEFFSKRSTHTQFETVLSGPDILHPAIIENIVTEYCTLVSLCQERQGLEYNMLKQLRAGTVQEFVFENVDNYIRTQKWDDVAVRSMQKCAIGLNHISGGPAYIRRMDLRGFAFSTGDISEWSTVKLDLTHYEDASSILDSVAAYVESQKASETGPSSRTPSTTSTQGVTMTKRESFKSEHSQYIDEGIPDDVHKTSMNGMHMVSAFDHVVYPFPETRAIEVAQSRQITREMSQAGIYSRGALPEDVVNRPPRHTWPPGTISIWAKPLPIDPLNVVKQLWSGWRNGKAKRNSLRQPRPRPAITPRTPRRDWVDEHPRLRPLLDRKNRISKRASKVDRSSTTDSDRGSIHSHVHTPMLRGGAGSPDLPDYQSPSPPTAPADLSDVERQVRFDRLYRRVRGFWPDANMPRPDLIVDLFLIPTGWDVDAAYAIIRQLAEDGLLPHADRPDPFMIDQQDYADLFAGSGAVQPYNLPAHGVQHGVNGVRNGVNGVNGIHHGVNGAHHGQDGLGILDTPTHPQRQVDGVRMPLQTLLQAQLSPGGGNDVLPDAVNANNAFGTAPFAILEDSPGRRTPALPDIQPDRSFPAPNQQHQAQNDRLRANLPPQQQNDNHSNIENQSPASTILIPRTPSPRLVQTQPPCMARLCHPCPTYTGLFHHVCTVQGPHAVTGRTPEVVRAAQAFLDSLDPLPLADALTPLQPPADRPLPNDQIQSSAGSPSNGPQDQPTHNGNTPNDTGAPNGTSTPNGASMPNDAGLPAPTSNAQAAVNNSTSRSPANIVNNNSPATTAAPMSTSPTHVAGHNLRNRTRLSARRAMLIARLEGRDPADTATTPTQVRQLSITNPVTPQAPIDHSDSSAALDDPRDPDWLPSDPDERFAYMRRRMLRRQIQRDTPGLPRRLGSSSSSSTDSETSRQLQQFWSTLRRRRRANSTPWRRGLTATRGRATRT